MRLWSGEVRRRPSLVQTREGFKGASLVQFGGASLVKAREAPLNGTAYPRAFDPGTPMKGTASNKSQES